MNTIGIDVGCKELVLVVMVNGKARNANAFDNTPSGHQEIIRSLTKLKGETKVCIEATGVYHFDLAVALSRANDIEVMVINPKAAHNFFKVLMTRSKTDAIDAENLAIYAQRMPFVAWERPADECIGLRATARRIAALNKQKTQTKNQLHALVSTMETPALVIEQTELLIDILDAQVKTLRDSALTIIGQNEGLEQAYTLINLRSG